jgi:NAD(P)-dependent dehydrogenase (short-subunit alcohol dehydrogenase family)
VITGGTSGVGLATARLLVQGGARVLVTGRSNEGLQRVADELGGNAVATRSDSSSLEDIVDLAAQAEARLGALDLLFVNAGITRSGALEAMTEEVYDELFATNVKGPYFTVQRLAPLLRKGGAMVFTTSVSNVKGQPGTSAYAATKAALRSMTRSFARELQPRGIRVNAVSPGPIDTGILERSLPPEAAAAARDRMTQSNPTGRFGEPAEVARAVAFLAFEATYTTGAELTVDGGTSQL